MNDLKLKKDQVFITRMNGRLKAILAKQAEKEGMTMSEYINKLLLSDLKSKKVKFEVVEKIC